jgi:hypothetical protein
VAYRNLCTAKLVPASRLSCLTEFFPCVDANSFKSNYAHLISRTSRAHLRLDIFGGPSLEALYGQVTAYAAGYDAVIAELIQSLVATGRPAHEAAAVNVDCRLDPFDGLWTSQCTLGPYTK